MLVSSNGCFVCNGMHEVYMVVRDDVWVPIYIDKSQFVWKLLDEMCDSEKELIIESIRSDPRFKYYPIVLSREEWNSLKSQHNR